MPNILDANGLQIKTLSEITDDLIASFQDTYGADINVGSNSPDGQMIGILAQALVDNLELLTQVYNSFSVDSAFGTVLDQRVSMNGVARRQGTYTQAIVDVTVDQALNLVGLDALESNPEVQVFAVADDAGNQFQLVASYSFGAAGTASLAFRSEVLGQVQTTANTIQTIITTQLGVLSVNNPTAAGDTEGLPEETDVQLKIRRADSFYLQAVGPADSLRAALLSTNGVVDAYVVQNDTGGIVDGVPAHSIWVVVNGGADADVANAIYTKKSPGCGMLGAQSLAVVRPQGNTFTAQWDDAVGQALSVKATLVPRIPGQTFDTAAAEEALALALVYRMGQSPNAGDVVIAMQEIEPLAILTDTKVSKDGGSTWEDVVTPDTAKNYFTVDASDITLT